MNFLRKGFKVETIKPALKMSVHRIQLLKNKKTVSIKGTKKIVAALLREGKEEKARISTEHIVREDFSIEAYDILELLVEVILERIRLLAAEKECPFDMREAVVTLIYASNRTEVPELRTVAEQLTKKYGKEFAERARLNDNSCVNERIVHKLSAQPPNAFLVMNYMKEIAEEFNIDWQPNEATSQVGGRFDTAMAPPSGMTVDSGVGSGLGASAYRYTDGRILPPGELPANFSPDDIPSAPMNGVGKSGNDYDDYGNGGHGGNDSYGGDLDLEKRFEKYHSSAGNPNSSSSKHQKSGNGNGDNDDNYDDGGFSFDDIPSAPTGKTGKGKGRGGDGGSDGGDHQFQDDPSTHGKDAEAVPDFDELTARFNALKK